MYPEILVLIEIIEINELCVTFQLNYVALQLKDLYFPFFSTSSIIHKSVDI